MLADRRLLGKDGGMNPPLVLKEWINVPSFALLCGIIGAASGLVLCLYNLAFKWAGVWLGNAEPDLSDTFGRVATSFGFSAIIGFAFAALAGMASFVLLRWMLDLGLSLMALSLLMALVGGGFAIVIVYLMYSVGVINIPGFPVTEMIVVGLAAALGSMTLGRVSTRPVPLARAA